MDATAMRAPRAVPLAILLLAACGHASSALQDGVLHKGDVRVHLGPVPESWSQVRVEGADVAYRDQGRAGSVLLDVRCGERDDDAPLSVLTSHLIMGTTERQPISEETVPFDGREALHTVMRAKLDGVDLQYDMYVMKKDGCVYDIVYLSPPSRYQEGAAAFAQFARGLHASSPPVQVGGARAPSTNADP
jgi:hypothetical protein